MGSGVHMIDVKNPLKPRYTGCYAQDGYVYDMQVEYQAKEEFLCINEDSTNRGYTEQGTLIKDDNYLLFGDKRDDLCARLNKTMYAFEVRDPTSQQVANTFAYKGASDQNPYVKGGYVDQAYYMASLRISDLTDMPVLELGFGVGPYEVKHNRQAVGSGDHFIAFDIVDFESPVKHILNILLGFLCSLIDCSIIDLILYFYWIVFIHSFIFSTIVKN